jgi:hypothetical protein
MVTKGTPLWDPNPRATWTQAPPAVGEDNAGICVIAQLPLGCLLLNGRQSITCSL